MYMCIHPNKIEMMGRKTWENFFGKPFSLQKTLHILLSAFYYRTLIYIDFYRSNFGYFCQNIDTTDTIKIEGEMDCS